MGVSRRLLSISAFSLFAALACAPAKTVVESKPAPVGARKFNPRFDRIR